MSPHLQDTGYFSSHRPGCLGEEERPSDAVKRTKACRGGAGIVESQLWTSWLLSPHGTC